MHLSTDETTDDAPHVLRYHRKVMQPEPVNISLARAAALLDAGETVTIVLQPGDGTSYTLLVVPVWSKYIDASRLGFGVERTNLREYLYVVNAEDCHALRGTTIERDSTYEQLHECGWFAPWTFKLLEWWFEYHLWPRLVAIRGARA